MFPIGNIFSLRVEWTLDTIANFILAAMALGSLATYTISGVEFCAQK